MQGIFFLVAIVSSLWVLSDSIRLGAKRGGLGGGLLDMGPVGWFLVTLLFWIVGMPCYLVTRPRLVTRHRALKTYGHLLDPRHPQFIGATRQLPVLAGPAPAAPPPGWYPDPEGRPCGRWWDGLRWTEHTS
jgi:hypothetical protein